MSRWEELAKVGRSWPRYVRHKRQKQENGKGCWDGGMNRNGLEVKSEENKLQGELYLVQRQLEERGT